MKNKSLKNFRKSYYISEDNLHRSLSIYYSEDVMGKRKYISVRQSNKSNSVVNFVPYRKLAEYSRSLDIGRCHNINQFSDGLDSDEVGDGKYRDLISYAPVLAEFYIRRNQFRLDKLATFTVEPRKDPSSVMFFISVGGDEAPGAGTTFLVSFLNIGKQVSSSKENFLIFGGNVKESGRIVKRYCTGLLLQLQYLESTVFEFMYMGKRVLYEFKVNCLPNDLKMLAFLSGELTNVAYYFVTFANVNQDNCRDVNKVFSLVEAIQFQKKNRRFYFC